jgi:hypothetical protein
MRDLPTIYRQKIGTTMASAGAVRLNPNRLLKHRDAATPKQRRILRAPLEPLKSAHHARMNN